MEKDKCLYCANEMCGGDKCTVDRRIFDEYIRRGDVLRHTDYLYNYGNVVSVSDIIATPAADVVETASEIVSEISNVNLAEVVRCKDCEHCVGKAPWGDYLRCDHPCIDYDIECYDQWVNVHPDDFCSYGKRKKEV